MPAGLIVYNDFGTVLIDDTNVNLALIAKGTDKVRNVAIIGPSVLGWAISPNSPNFKSPLLAYACSTALCGGQPNTLDGLVGPDGGGQYYFFGGGTFAGTAPAVNDDVYWFLFDKPIAPTGVDDCGLQVFDTTGQLCFDSRLKHPRIVAAPTMTSLTPITVNLPNGRKYACASRGFYCKINDGVITVRPASAAFYNVPCLIVDCFGY